MSSSSCAICGKGSVIEYNEVDYCGNCLGSALREQAAEEAEPLKQSLPATET